MCCILCLKIASPTTTAQIEIYSSKGQLLGIEHIIKKHFWLQPNAETPKTRSICQQCWQALSQFHQFYLQIQEAHNSFERTTVLTDVISPLDYNNEPVATESIKLESELVKVETNVDAIIDEVPVTKTRGRGRPKRKKSSCVENSNDDTISKWENVDILDIKEEQTMDANVYDDAADMLGSSDEAEQSSQLLADDNIETSDSEIVSKQKKVKRKTKVCKRKPSPSERTLVTKRNDEFIAENFKFSCCICQVPLPNFSEVKTHFRMQHQTRGYVLCCGKKFLKRGVLVDHIHTHLDPQYFKCQLCNRVMASRRCLELHNKNHEDSRERIYRCEVCSKSYYRQSVFRRHMLTHVPDEEKKIPCPQCDKIFPTNYIMNQHLKLVHLNMYVKICDICGKSIRGKEALKRHQEEHEGVQRPPIQCELCGVTLTTKYGLARHLKVMHTEEFRKPQICTICSKVSPTLSAHQRHMQYMHSMERKHSCPMCDKAFKRPTDLREHMTTHTGEVLYTCPHCPKTFNSNANMHSHRKKMHRKEWEEKRRQRYNIMHESKSEQLLQQNEEILSNNATNSNALLDNINV